jgi:uncharacterized membrane protein YagU involved in acid resistance
MAGAVAGGLVAGLGITALLMAGERKSGEPSEIVTLERKTAEKLGIDTPAADALPSSGEQAVTQGGHLLLSAAAGAVYAATVDEETSVIGSGLVFGAAFYAAMHWITGPLLGVKPPEWQADAKTIGMHSVNHAVFGLVTALGAKLATRRRNRVSVNRDGAPVRHTITRYHQSAASTCGR